MVVHSAQGQSQTPIVFAQLQVLEAWQTICTHTHTQYVNSDVNNQNNNACNEILIENETFFYLLQKNNFPTAAHCDMTISFGI